MDISIILGNLGNTCDRFLSTGYKEQPPKEEMIRQASKIPGVKAVELVGTWDITPENVDEMGDLLHKYSLKCASIIPDHFSQKRWGMGAFTSLNPSIREQAKEETIIAAELAKKLGCGLINLWPGQDGYDYPLQADYDTARRWLIDAVKDIASLYPDIKFSLEYKPKEPRTHSYMARAADTLLIAKETGLPNVGVTIDTGHSMVGGENMAESAVLLHTSGRKLFHMHFNDNYRSWDDDMIVGSVHLVEFLELLFWLKKLGYSGWYSMDQYPYREDAQGALQGSIEFLMHLDSLLSDETMREIEELLAMGDAVRSSKWVRELIFK